MTVLKDKNQDLKPKSKIKITVKKKAVPKKRKLNGSGSGFKLEKVKPKKASVRKITVLDLIRSKKNPIIEPKEERYWESKATFNPTAFLSDGKVHIVYRAIGDSDNSVLGYAESRDGVSISDSFPKPIYFHFSGRDRDVTLKSISYVSGGGWGGGTEDPRITQIGDKVYMLYTAFDGWGSVRIAMTSISLEDFIDKCWNWKEPVLISPPGQINKNWVIFPEKIKKDGKEKYAILHAISPEIMISYLDSLEELDGKNFIYSVHQGNRLWEARDRLIRGVGPAPLKTKYGWLVFYHKMEKHDTHRYKLWAMILDYKDPTQILYNSNQPVLEPDAWYENEGYKSGVVYSCGAVIKDGVLFVYYGGADKVSCVATADLDKFLEGLVYENITMLATKKNKS